MQALHHKLAIINGPAAELKIAKQCLGESKVQHYLRMYGADLLDTLDDADHAIDITLNRIATGLNDFGRRQAMLGIRAGGVGYDDSST